MLARTELPPYQVALLQPVEVVREAKVTPVAQVDCQHGTFDERRRGRWPVTLEDAVGANQATVFLCAAVARQWWHCRLLDVSQPLGRPWVRMGKPGAATRAVKGLRCRLLWSPSNKLESCITDLGRRLDGTGGLEYGCCRGVAAPECRNPRSPPNAMRDVW